MARKRKAPAGNIPGHPSTWKGKEYRALRSRNVVEVLAYERGAGGHFHIRYRYTQCPATPTVVDSDARFTLSPETFRQRYTPYGPDDPMTDIPKPLPLPEPTRRNDRQ